MFKKEDGLAKQYLESLVQMHNEFLSKNGINYCNAMLIENSGTPNTPGAQYRLHEFLLQEELCEFLNMNKIPFELKSKGDQNFLVIKKTDFNDERLTEQKAVEVFESFAKKIEAQLQAVQQQVNENTKHVEALIENLGDDSNHLFVRTVTGDKYKGEPLIVSQLVFASVNSKFTSSIKESCEQKDIQYALFSFAKDDGHPKIFRLAITLGKGTLEALPEILSKVMTKPVQSNKAKP